MILQEKQKTPVGDEGLATALNDNPSLADTSHGIDPAAFIHGVHVIVVQVRGEHVPPRYRRRVMFNLPAAQRAVDKATQDGLEAHIVLCQLIPAGVTA